MRTLWTCWLILATASCTPHAVPEKKQAVCIPHQARVVDEAGNGVAGAVVRTTMTYRKFGPSMMPEGSYLNIDESPVVITDASGAATVCLLDQFRQGTIEVEYRDWPRATRPWHEREIAIGPARAAVAQVPPSATCTDPKQVQVAAYAEPIAPEAVIGVQRPTNSFTLVNLGPWRYWVRSVVCGQTVVRSLDGRDVPAVLIMDRNEAVIDHPELAGATATLRSFRNSTPLVTATLSAAGTATLEMPGSQGSAYCLTLQRDDRCVVTFIRAGEVSRPGMYSDRDGFLARDCLACPATP